MQLEHPHRTNKKIDWGKAICSIVIVWMVLLTANATVTSSSQYTDKQLDALASRVGKIFWIKSQPWSPAVKEAAIKKQPTPGLNTAEVKRVLGAPRRVTKLRGLTKVAEEHWFYPDGSVLIFNNGLLTRTEKAQTN